MYKSTVLLFFSALLFIYAVPSPAQSLRPYDVDGSPFKVYCFGTPKCDLTYSEDSSKVWTCYSEKGDSTDLTSYMFIGVELKAALTSKEDVPVLIKNYLDFLKSAFEVSASAGYGEGHTIESMPEFQGVRDYWTDLVNYRYNVMGWGSTRYLGIMLVYRNGREPDYNQSEVFLQGFRLKK